MLCNIASNLVILNFVFTLILEIGKKIIISSMNVVVFSVQE